MYVIVNIRNENLVALVDTGASGFAFVSQSMSDRLNLQKLPLRSPIALVGFEGNRGSQITHQVIVPLSLENHSEKINAFVIEKSKYDIILGLPWLEEHAPLIDWKNHTITFGESCLIKGCCKFKTTVPYINTPTIYPHSTSNTSATQCPNRAPKTNISHLNNAVIQPADFKIRLANIAIPKDANPKDYLPPQYHDFLDVFDRDKANTLPPHRPWDHPIDLEPGKQPPAAKPYSMNQNELKALRKYLDEELSKGFIRVSRSPAAAPVLFVKKQNGDLRFCIDYRGLNSISLKNRHSLPLISETLGLLSQAKYFTKLDIISAFNKLRIKDGDEWKAAFTCRYGLFEPLVLPFGLSNGPASFQAYINHSLRGLLDQICTAYMDDILVFSKLLLIIVTTSELFYKDFVKMDYK